MISNCHLTIADHSLDNGRFYELSVDLLATFGFDGFLKAVNPAWSATLGFSEAELLSRPFMELAHPGDQEACGLEVQRLLQGCVSINFENRILCQDGSYRRFSWTATPYLERDCFYGIGRDITDVRRAEETVAYLSAIVESSDDAIIGVGLDGTINAWNRGASQLYGYAAQEAIGRSILMLNPHGQSTNDLELLRQLKDGDVVHHVQRQRRRKDGRCINVSITLSPIKDARGEVIGASKITRDITDWRRSQDLLKAYNRRLQELNEAAQTANRAKSEFLANMSHEIRTPLTPILGYADVIAEAGSSPLVVDAADCIRRNGHHLLAIINDILDLSKIEAGGLAVERVAFPPRQLIEEVVGLMNVRAQEKRLPLSVRYLGEIPELIESDPTRIRQILMNLVGNAIKFTATGQVRIVAQLDVEGEGEARLRLDVEDTGIGIRSADMNRVFEPFAQADASTTRKFGGSGLGLAISKRLIERLGGTISVASTPGVGSTFSVSLPWAKIASPVQVALKKDPDQDPDGAAAATQAAVARPPATRKARLLLAEDNPDSRRLITVILQKQGAEVVAVENGEQAVAAVLEGENRGKPYDVVLMDVQMPVLDGLEATRRLRQRNYGGPIIALTAHAMNDDRIRCLEAGCDDYETKPIQRDRLAKVIAKHMGRNPAQAPARGAS
jgi:PAS domain S-box-containing protein